MTPTREDRRRWSKIKSRARREGIPFNIAPGDIPVPDYCPVLGIALHKTGQGRGPADHAPSVDRIDPSKGYVKGNVLVVSLRANRIKQNAAPSEILAVGRYYHQLEKERNNVFLDEGG